ncbi:MAG: SpaA isopeptide-forming pilin-related protein [Oribacterium sp.]|nr:SpaA isopeptide-forming pilin-related protein [Oribacterium sp.]
MKETITAVEETFGVIHSEAAENEGFATESELEKETTAAAAEEKKENAKTEMDTVLENERKDLLKDTKASELLDSSVASAKVLQYTLDDLSKAYWSAEIEGEYEVNVFAEKTAFDADDQVKLQLKKLDKPEEAEDGTLATTDDTLSKEQVDALKADGSYENSQSIDIRFVDEDGKEVEPKTPVKVKIKVYKEALPEDADISTMTIKHLDESTGSVQAATVASYGETANGAIKAVDEQGKKVELKSVDADTTEAADEKVEAASVAASTTKEVLPEEAVGVESTFTVKSFSSFTIAFANTGDELTTVKTVSNKDLGLHLYMTDFTDNSRFKGGEYYDAHGGLTQGIYSSIIKANSEFPTLTNKAYTGSGNLKGTSISQWCGKQTDGAGKVTNEVDHLFLKSRYDKDGYFYYNSADNFATLKEQNTGETTDTFKVYKQLGTPEGGGEFFYKRGNFMPYNRLDINNRRNSNLYDYKGNLLPDGDSRKYEPLYGFIEHDNNFYFGMYGYAKFYQPEDGKVNGKDMVYKFTGDDDLVVYVDDVLVLDLGGIHEAQSGSIDFTTGDIEYTNYINRNPNSPTISTTIKKQFLAAYKEAYGEKEGKEKFDNLTWHDTKDTFKYGTKHTIKFFYMERGAGASNLRLEMNIQPIPGGSLTVHKKVDNLNLEQAKNETFKFKLLDKNDKPLGKEPYTVGVGNEAATPPTTDKDGTFTLKGNESAVFTQIKENTIVKVVEQGIDSNSKYEMPLYAATDKDNHTVKGSNIVTIPGKEDDVLIDVTNRLKSPKSLSITKKFYVDGSEDKQATDKIDKTAFGKAKFVLQEKKSDDDYTDLYEITYQDIAYKNGTYTFNELDPTKTYKVIEKITASSADNGGNTETKISYKETEYQFGKENSQNIGSDNPATSDFLLTDESTTLTFINKYESAPKDITFTKVDYDYKDTKLSGAYFVIAKKGTDDKYTTITESIKDVSGKVVVNSDSTTDGKFEIPNNGITLKLSPGDYQLTEVKAPNGYNLLTNTVNFTIRAGKLSVGTDDMYYMNSDENGVIIKNKAGVALPITGGTGTILFSLGGMALMLIALGYTILMKRKEKGGLD